MAEELSLLGMWASPFSCRVKIALKLKVVQYKYVEEDLFNKSPLLLKYNPIDKKVPVLVHNGNPLLESLVILEYIDETWQGYPIFPKDPYERAVARFWAKFIDDKLLPAIRRACWGEEKGREKAVEEATELLQLLEMELKEKRFFGGETIGLVDIVADTLSLWLTSFEEGSGVELMTREKFPKLSKWSHEFASTSAVKENLPPKDELTVFLKSLFGKPAK
ncbi:glutathione S-transferase U8-like [Carya illinoinensis]|uniref:glutathione transferase n=1 Tax=Carya illinoinensis TaxID=32201 RepID=A0A8T1PN57_CARIL|nr:glutathione S-transferase U8-like [Carya illinoinensis]KAG6643314.1 hypothetical protein CIPAW_09G202400 [Carya illinoinensis]